MFTSSLDHFVGHNIETDHNKLGESINSTIFFFFYIYKGEVGPKIFKKDEKH
jgi:hypothetical protein